MVASSNFTSPDTEKHRASTYSHAIIFILVNSATSYLLSNVELVIQPSEVRPWDIYNWVACRTVVYHWIPFLPRSCFTDTHYYEYGSAIGACVHSVRTASASIEHQCFVFYIGEIVFPQVFRMARIYSVSSKLNSLFRPFLHFCIFGCCYYPHYCMEILSVSIMVYTLENERQLYEQFGGKKVDRFEACCLRSVVKPEYNQRNDTQMEICFILCIDCYILFIFMWLLYVTTDTLCCMFCIFLQTFVYHN